MCSAVKIAGMNSKMTGQNTSCPKPWLTGAIPAWEESFSSRVVAFRMLIHGPARNDGEQAGHQARCELKNCAINAENGPESSPRSSVLNTPAKVKIKTDQKAATDMADSRSNA